jgi:beta-lactamase regulating signal transducer with metallopeptidase domain
VSWWLAQHLVTVAILVAVVHLACGLLKLGPATRHALWALVLLKLVTPPVVAWPWEVPHETAAVAAGLSTRATAFARPTPPAYQLEGAYGSAVDLSAAAQGASAMRWQSVALVVWIVGIAGTGAIEMTRCRRIARHVRTADPPSATLEAVVADLATRQGVRAPAVRLSSAVTSPFIWAFRRPTLMWPKTLPLPDESDGAAALAAHELAHIKRRDHWIGWLDLVAGCVWWWNPICWHVRANLRHHAELAADAWAMALVPGARRTYAETLVTLSAPHAPAASALTLRIVGHHRRLERRLVMIMQSRRPPGLSRFGVLLIGITAALTLPAWAQRAGNGSAPPPSVAMPQPLPVPLAGAAEQVPRPSAAPSVPAPSVRVPIVPEPPRSSPEDVDQELQSVAERVARLRAELAVKSDEVQRVAERIGRQQVFFPMPLPEEAQALLDRFQESSARTRQEADAKIAAEREATVAELQQIQDAEARAGNLDAAVAVRDRIRALQNGANLSMRRFYPSIVSPF